MRWKRFPLTFIPPLGTLAFPYFSFKRTTIRRPEHFVRLPGSPKAPIAVLIWAPPVRWRSQFAEHREIDRTISLDSLAVLEEVLRHYGRARQSLGRRWSLGGKGGELPASQGA